jgi:hypothetical protein
MYFCSLFAILGTKIDVLSVRIGEAVKDQHHRDSYSGSPVSKGYGLIGNEFTDAADASPWSRATDVNARIFG